MGLGLWPQPGHPTPPPKFDRQPPRKNIRHASVAGERVDWCANSAPAPRAELTRAHLATTEPDPHAHEPAARPDRVPDELIHGGSVSLELSSCRRRRPHGGTPPPARHATGERTFRAPPRSNRRAPLPAAAPARRVHGGLLAPPPPVAALPAGLQPSRRLAPTLSEATASDCNSKETQLKNIKREQVNWGSLRSL